MGIRRLEHFENFLGAVGCEPHGQGMEAVGRWEQWERWELWERWGASRTGRKSQRDSEKLGGGRVLEGASRTGKEWERWEWKMKRE